MRESGGRRLRRVVPSAITLGGLALAVWSMTLAIEGRYEAAAWAVFGAACVDVVDGGLARSLDAITPFGKQLDSLADLVAAGVAPAVLVHGVYFGEWGGWGVGVAFAWVAMVAIRLARFNTAVLADDFHFVGVPCPIAATVLSQYVVFSEATWGDQGRSWVAAVLVAALGVLMMSDVPYWKSATLLPGQFLHHPYGPGVAGTALGAVAFPRQAVFVGTALSVVVAAVIRAVRVRATTGPPPARAVESSPLR